jgi:hypothetical protein
VTLSEWLKIAAVDLQARWPNRPIPEESIKLWFEDLAEFPADQVRAAVLALYRDGREWSPNGAQIRAKLSELSRDDPDHGAAWALVNRALANYGVYDWPGFYRYLEERSPAVAEAARRHSFEPSGYLKADESTVRAQFREIYKAVVAERTRNQAYAGIPTANLRGLERGPRRLGDVLRRALPEGSTA